jgi:hypothetical protein
MKMGSFLAWLLVAAVSLAAASPPAGSSPAASPPPASAQADPLAPASAQADPPPADSLPAQTYMLLVEQTLDGQVQEDPAVQAGLQGIMSGMFERGQVTFDSGPYRPEADWEHLRFSEPLSLAREGMAHYLATVRFEASSAPGEEAAFSVQASFQLWSAFDGSMLGEGAFSVDNVGREKELPYKELLFEAGEKAAAELGALAAGRTGRRLP